MSILAWFPPFLARNAGHDAETKMYGPALWGPYGDEPNVTKKEQTRASEGVDRALYGLLQILIVLRILHRGGLALILACGAGLRLLRGRLCR